MQKEKRLSSFLLKGFKKRLGQAGPIWQSKDVAQWEFCA